jgi:hypothetical protein
VATEHRFFSALAAVFIVPYALSVCVFIETRISLGIRGFLLESGGHSTVAIGVALVSLPFLSRQDMQEVSDNHSRDAVRIWSQSRLASLDCLKTGRVGRCSGPGGMLDGLAAVISETGLHHPPGLT